MVSEWRCLQSSIVGPCVVHDDDDDDDDDDDVDVRKKSKFASAFPTKFLCSSFQVYQQS